MSVKKIHYIVGGSGWHGNVSYFMHSLFVVDKEGALSTSLNCPAIKEWNIESMNVSFLWSATCLRPSGEAA